jgi:hypothetical protein
MQLISQNNVEIILLKRYNFKNVEIGQQCFQGLHLKLTICYVIKKEIVSKILINKYSKN